MLKGQAKGITPVLHAQHCLSSCNSEEQHIDVVIVTSIIVSSMHSNGQSPKQTALDHYINP